MLIKLGIKPDLKRPTTDAAASIVKMAACSKSKVAFFSRPREILDHVYTIIGGEGFAPVAEELVSTTRATVKAKAESKSIASVAR